MKKVYYLIAALLFSFNASSQTRDKRAKEFYESGMDNVLKKNYPEAVANFSEAIKRDTDFIQAYENRGVAKFYLHDNRGAIADYSRALEINPNDYNTHGRRGWAEFSLREYESAIADFTKAIKGSADKIQYFGIRGEARYLIHDYEGAIADLSKVIRSLSARKDQKNKAYYWRGLAKIESGQKEGGCLDLDKAGKSGYPDADEAIKKYCR